MRPACRTEPCFDIRNQLLNDRISIRAVVVRVDLIRVAKRASAVELKQDKTRRVISQPRFLKFRFFSHQLGDATVTRIQTADAHPKWIAPRRLPHIIARQNHARAQKNWPAMKSTQQFGLKPHELHVLRLRRQLFQRNLLAQFECHCFGRGSVQMSSFRDAQQVSHCVGRTHVRVAIEQSLDEVIARYHESRVRARKLEGVLINRSDGAGRKSMEITRESQRTTDPMPPKRESRLGIIGSAKNYEQPSILRTSRQTRLGGNLETDRCRSRWNR